MPSPKLARCAIRTEHEPHFWEPPGYNIFEGDALNWCEGEGASITELNNTNHNNLVVPWETIGIARLQQDNEDGLFEYTALIVEVPRGKMIFPITEHKQEQPPVGLQVRLQTSAKALLETIKQIQLWDSS